MNVTISDKLPFLLFLFLLTFYPSANAIEVITVLNTDGSIKTKMTQSKEYVYISSNQFIYKIPKSFPVEFRYNHSYYSEYYHIVDDFIVDKNETLWVGTSFGLFYNTNSDDIKNFYNSTFTDVGNEFYSIELDSNNTVWLSSNKGLWAIKDMKAKQVFKLLDDSLPDTIRKIVIDPFNRKLFVADTCYYRYNDTNITKYSLPQSETFNCRSINNINLTHLGNLSIATNCGLLLENDVDSKKFQLYNKKAGDLTNDIVNCSGSDSIYFYIGKGNIKENKLAGLTIGKINYSNNRISFIASFLELFIYENIESLILDQYGNIWFNTYFYFAPEQAHWKTFFVMNLNEIKFTEVNEKIDFSLSLSPNPVTEKLILINIPDNATEYEIYDQFGNRHLSGLISGQIDVSLLPAGVYFIKLNNSQRPLKFLKI